MVNEKIVTYDERPWGSFEVIKSLNIDNEDVVIKKIIVSPLMRLSLQSHNNRIESWVIVSGFGKVENGENITLVEKGSVLHIQKNTKHRVTNISEDKPLIFIEVAQGDFDENDIIRYQDDFGRN